MRFLLLMVLIFPIFSSAQERYPFENKQLSERFENLTHRFRCLVCQNEDLAASGASLAIKLKDDLYEQLSAGQSDEQIQSYLVNRYGDFVLFKPPVVKRTWVLWYAPWFFLFLGVLVIAWRIQQKGSHE
jgi:cytochrome c-type biogenesis protein CcmH